MSSAVICQSILKQAFMNISLKCTVLHLKLKIKSDLQMKVKSYEINTVSYQEEMLHIGKVPKTNQENIHKVYEINEQNSERTDST